MNEVNVPRLPLSERDRRHANVRAAMRKAGIDVLVLPANHCRWDQMMADSRYLTTIGGYGTETLTIMPIEGEVTAGVFNRAAWWRRAQDWIADVRDCTNDWGKLVVDRLNDKAHWEVNLIAGGKAAEGVTWEKAESTADLLPPSSIPGPGQRRPPAPRSDRNFFEKLFGG